MDYNLCIRILDIYLLEGPKTIYRFAVALFKVNENKFNKDMQMEEIMHVIQNIANGIDINTLFNCAFEIQVKKTSLKVKLNI